MISYTIFYLEANVLHICESTKHFNAFHLIIDN